MSTVTRTTSRIENGSAPKDARQATRSAYVIEADRASALSVGASRFARDRLALIATTRSLTLRRRSRLQWSRQRSTFDSSRLAGIARPRRYFLAACRSREQPFEDSCVGLLSSRCQPKGLRSTLARRRSNPKVETHRPDTLIFCLVLLRSTHPRARPSRCRTLGRRSAAYLPQGRCRSGMCQPTSSLLSLVGKVVRQRLHGFASITVASRATCSSRQ